MIKTDFVDKCNSQNASGLLKIHKCKGINSFQVKRLRAFYNFVIQRVAVSFKHGMP